MFTSLHALSHQTHVISLGSARSVVYSSTDKSWGGTPLYKLYSHVPSHRVGFLRRFRLRVFTLPILVWNRVWFLRELRRSVRIYRFNSKRARRREI